MTTDLTKLLDELDAAREKATPGQWGTWWRTRIGTSGVEVGTVSQAEDAALIVAAVNNLSGLVTIAREFWNEHDGRICHDRTADSHNGNALCPTRAFIADALVPEQAS